MTAGRRSAFSPALAGPDKRLAAFRVFFPAAAMSAIALVIVPAATAPGAIPLAWWWHAREGMFGYGGAILAGFVLTALPNWLGRRPPKTPVVLTLATFWLAGRAGLLLEAMGWSGAGLFDLGLPLGLLAFATREVLAAGNRRNRKIVLLLALYASGRIVAAAESFPQMAPDSGTRLGAAALVLLIMTICGRMIPVFTQDALGAGNGPAPRHDGLDAIAILAGLAALPAWAFAPQHVVTAGLLAIAGAFNLVRLCRWSGLRVWRQADLIFLHIGYGFIPLGLALCAGAAFSGTVSPGAGLHAFTAGAMGVVSLAVMIRMIEGHIRAPRSASCVKAAILGFVAVSACLRITHGIEGMPAALLAPAAMLWVAGFTLFLLAYGPIILGRPHMRRG